MRPHSPRPGRLWLSPQASIPAVLPSRLTAPDGLARIATGVILTREQQHRPQEAAASSTPTGLTKMHDKAARSCR
jgi:hypothetical protein